jgi:hypothetical protein
MRRRHTSAISRTAVRILEGIEGVSSSGWDDNVLSPDHEMRERRGTHIGLKCGRVPFHKLHEVPSVCSKEYFMAIFEFWSKILASEIVMQIYKYGHSLGEESIRGSKKSRNGQLKESEVGSKELGVDQFDGGPKRIGAGLGAP